MQQDPRLNLPGVILVLSALSFSLLKGFFVSWVQWAVFQKMLSHHCYREIMFLVVGKKKETEWKS